VARAADVSVVWPPGTGWRRPATLLEKGAQGSKMVMPRWRVEAVVLAAMLSACSVADEGTPAAAPTSLSSSAQAAGSSVWPASPATDLLIESRSGLQGEIDRWVSKGLVPGVTAAVVTPEGVWSGAAGVDGRGTPLVPESGMALASITKTFTAAEVMLLSERGRVDLDAPASTYIDVPQVANGVTIRQLLAQRSGVAESREAGLGDRNGAWSTAEYLTFVPPATAKPGLAFAYDNTNYVLLGMVIERVSGRSVGDALKADLWDPLGLRRLAYQDAQRLPPPLARPPAQATAEPELDRCVGEGPVLPCRALATLFGTAGGAAGDVEAVARWGYELYGSRLLRPESVDQLTDFQDGDGYGLGTIDIRALENGRWDFDAVGHTGETVGYRSVLVTIPEAKVSVAILTPSTVEVLPLVKRLAAAGSLLQQ